MDNFKPPPGSKKPRRARPIRIKPLSEDKIQEYVVAWLETHQDRYGRPFIFTHIPNGGKRSQEYAAKLKRMGLRAGWPDLMIMMYDGKFGCLELKKSKKSGKVSPEQLAFADECHYRCIHHAFAYGYKEAIDILKKWFKLD